MQFSLPVPRAPTMVCSWPRRHSLLAAPDAKKIIVFFTDGTPTSQSEFNSTVANAAVTAAKEMKDGKATVYTIGIFDGADPNAGVQDSKTSQENKFMQAVSSNYPNATA